MKKLIVLGALAAFAAPVFAADKQEAPQGPQHFKDVRHEMMQKDPAAKAKMEAFKAKQEARKATEEKLEKLVKEYKKAKDGSKKQTAAKEEIAKVLGEVRDEQIAQRAQGLEGFEKRLAEMKNRLAEEQKPEAKTAWVDDMTAKVIEADGKLGKVFAKDGGRMGHGPQSGEGRGGFEGKGPKTDKGFGHKGHGGHEDHILPMPPAPQEAM